VAPKRETLLVRKVLKWLRDRGWWAEKFHGGPYQRAGIPDILALHPQSRPLWIECKTGVAEPTTVQKVVMAELLAAGCRVVVVRELSDLEALERV
jgi:Holliday junction resolvase